MKGYEKMKKILSLFLTLAMCLSTCVVASAEDAKVIYTLESGTCYIGETAEFDISVACSENVNTLAVSNFVYDSNVLEFVSFSDFDQAIKDNLALSSMKPDSAKMAVSVPLSSPMQFNGRICSMTFKAKEGATAGKYTVSATSVAKNSSTVVTSSVVVAEITVTERPKPDIEGLSMNDDAVTYDGTAKTIEVVGAPDDAKVEYTYAKAEGNDTVDKAIDAGTYKVTATVSKEGYNNWEGTATLTINPKTLTVSGLAADSKTYDGTTDAVVTGGTLSGKVDGDEVDATLPKTGTFANANVGNEIAVSIADITLTGADKDNYTLTQPTGLKANITKRPITVTAKDVTVKVGTKVDDIAKLLKYDVEGLVDGEKLTGALAVDGKVDFSKVSEYDIVQGTLDAGSNYDLKFVPAKLKVIDKTPQTISVADIDAMTYGDAPFTLKVTADKASQLSAFKYASSDEKVATVDASGNVTIVGAGKATITVTEPGNADYAEATATAELTVAPKTITVTAVDMTADPKTATLEGVVGKDDVTVDFEKSVSVVKATESATIDAENDAIKTTFKFTEFKLKGNAAKNYVVSDDQTEITYATTEKTKTETAEDGTIITTVPAGDKTVVVSGITVGAQADDVKIPTPMTVSMTKTVFAGIADNNVPLTIDLKVGDTDKGSIVLDVAALTAIKTAATSATQISTSMKADVAVDDLTSAQQTEVAKVSAKTPKVYSLSVVDENGASLAGNFGDGKAVVRLPYTKPAGNGNVKVKHVANDGTLTDVASTYEDGFVKVELAHFSEYLVYTEPEVIVTGGGSASTYTVKFNTNGGSTIKSVSVNKNGVVAEPTAPTKKGYTFDGWYTDRQLTTPYDFTSKVTKNFTLFAKWIEDSKEPGTEEPGTDEPGTEEPTTVSFDDINETDWFYENVKYVVENKLMNGVSDTEFAPNNTLTRAMLVTVLYRNAGEPEVSANASFADVDADSWYAKAVVWAEANGIVNGVSDTEFAPNANITREQIATIMYRYAQYNGDDVTAVADIEAYADAANVSDYAVDAMKYAVGSGLINGKTETTLNPQDNATRAEIATILKRFIEANAEVEEVVEETTEEVVEETTEETTEEVVEETTEETAE